jgi:hypothetical protein
MGTAYFGQAKDTTFRITNIGSGSLDGVVAFIDNSPPFSVVGSPAYTLAAGQSQDIRIRFTSSGTPGHTYSYVGNLTAGTQCSSQGLDLLVTATAREQPPPPQPPQCHVETTTLDFGTVPVGQSKDLTFDLTNVGGGTLCGTVIESCPDFSIVANQNYCATPTGFPRVEVRFTPSTTGFQQCTILPGTGCPMVIAKGTGN